MLKLSLYGFEFHLIKKQYVIFYGDCKLPHDSIFNEIKAIRVVCDWISNGDWEYQLTEYNGPTAEQFKEAYSRLEKVSK